MPIEKMFRRSAEAIRTGSYLYWLLCGFLALVFAMGGSSRADIQSLAILYPVSAITCGIALMTLRRNHVVDYKPLVGMFAAFSALMVLHLVPLSPGLWQVLGGRAEIAQIDRAADLGAVWRPLTPATVNGWDGLTMLLVPLAVMLLGIQLDRDKLYRLLPVILGFGALSGLFALLQAVGDPGGAFYLYKVTNQGSAVGLFANRNHAAVLLACLFPMLAVFASSTRDTNVQSNTRVIAAAMLGAVFIPLVLVTGSRSGLLASLLGMAMAGILYRHKKPRLSGRGKQAIKMGSARIAVIVAVLCLVTLTVIFSRAKAINRLFESSFGNDSRGLFWQASIDMFQTAFPFGFGSGSYAEVYRISEPTALLDATYLNHAHNDWIEFGVLFGVPGLLLLAIALFVYVHISIRLWLIAKVKGRSVIYGRMASGLIVMLSVASMSDYPLRTPIMMSVMIIFLLWFFKPSNETAKLAQA